MVQAITVKTPGGAEQFAIEEVTLVPPGRGEVRIKVAAAGMNRGDIAQRQGHYPSPEGSPSWPGLEVSGTIIELGDGVSNVGMGDEVCALLGGGGYATEVVVDAGLVLPKPHGVSLIEAAALPEAVATVWSNLFTEVHLGAGHVLLIHGGASGIGTTAIQLAQTAGALVVVTAGTREKLEFCSSLGANVLINYHEEDFCQKLKATYPQGADFILDIIGGSYSASNVRTLAEHGTIVTIANQSGQDISFDPMDLMVKRGRWIATTLRGRAINDKRTIMAQIGERVWPLIREGALRPVIDSTYSFSQVSEAHRYLEGSMHMGKILLVP